MYTYIHVHTVPKGMRSGRGQSTLANEVTSHQSRPIILHYITLYYIILHYIILFNIISYYIIPYHTTPYHITSHHTMPLYLWLFRSGGEGAHVCRNIGATSRFRCTCCTFPVWKSYKCVERARPPVDFIQCNAIHTVTMTRQRVLYR